VVGDNMKTEILKYERIRDMRIDRGLTQKEVAKVINVKQNTYSQYEIGVLNYPLDVVIKLAEFYGTSRLFSRFDRCHGSI
jgi:transcriptional regulator with XRE-family HTH domain